MSTVETKREPNGLRVELGGDPPLRKLKADHGGIYFWDKKDVILDDLGSYLAKVEQSGQSALFTKIDANREVCRESSPMGTRKLRREVHEGLSRCLSAFNSRVNDQNLHADALRLIRAFRLPSPVKLPEFYRLYKDDRGQEQLLILWGCDRSEEDSVSLDDLPKLLAKESWLAEFLKRHMKTLLAAVALLLAVIMVLLYLSWPRTNVSVTKLDLSPGEPFMMSFDGSQGRSFDVSVPDASLTASSPAWSMIKSDAAELRFSTQIFPISKPEMPQLECSFSSPGQKKAVFASSTRFMGISLPARSREVIFNVRDIRQFDPQAGENVIGGRSKLSAKVVSGAGAFPASVEFISPVAGEIDFDNNEKGEIEPGRPLTYGGYEKPGLYKVAVKDSAGGGEETLYLPIPPAPGSGGLVSNLRLSKDQLNLGERLVADASSSYHGDPRKKIAAKRLSVDGGKSFQEMKGNYAVVPAATPGKMDLVLEVEDDAGSVSRDHGSVTVNEEEAPPLVSLDEIGNALPKDIRGVEIPNDLLFDKGKAEISEAGKLKLRSFAKQVAASGKRIEIVGHTDDTPISGNLRKQFADNKALSLARADSAAQLMRSEGVAPDRITLQGKGEEQPVSDAKTEEARRLNRRIEIFFLD